MSTSCFIARPSEDNKKMKLIELTLTDTHLM